MSRAHSDSALDRTDSVRNQSTLASNSSSHSRYLDSRMFLTMKRFRLGSWFLYGSLWFGLISSVAASKSSHALCSELLGLCFCIKSCRFGRESSAYSTLSGTSCFSPSLSHQVSSLFQTQILSS